MNEKEIMAFVIEKAKEKGFSRYRIAREVGVVDVQVRKWFEGTGYPSLPNFIKLCDFLEIDIKLKKRD